MPVHLVDDHADQALPIWFLFEDELSAADLPPHARIWAAGNAFNGEAGRLLVLPDADGAICGALFGLGEQGEDSAPLGAGSLGRSLPAGRWRFANNKGDAALDMLAVALGGYAFTRYNKKPGRDLTFEAPAGVDVCRVQRIANGVCLARDLINTPTADMGPDHLEEAVRRLGAAHGAEVSAIVGDALLAENLPMIHAVGRASTTEPRLIDLRWGREDAPKVTLVGKGVCFDTGGLDIKPSSSMLLMKKDMGGAANVLGLASMIMAARLPIRLRVLIPAVENAIAGNSFRPGDVLQSRKGLTIEIGNTDAEGRLVLADALALADEEAPEILIDMATLTGAARVALGPDLAPLFTHDGGLADALLEAGRAVQDPIWRMPLWKPYAAKLSSKIADLNNVTTDGFAGSITAALFLDRFVERARSHAHFDVFGWCPADKPSCPTGGEAHAIRAIEQVLVNRYRAS